MPHPGGNSALTFAFASLVTHTLFRTAPQDVTINNTTSYVDLSPLYGTNQAEQDLVRAHELVKDDAAIVAELEKVRARKKEKRDKEKKAFKKLFA